MAKYIEIEYEQDEIYYWLIFTVFFSSMSVLAACLFVISYKYMLYLRKKRLKNKVKSEFELNNLKQKNRITDDNESGQYD